MTMHYFTESGFTQVQIKYNQLIGNSFFFDNSEAKYELTDIIKQPSIQPADGLHVSFMADNGKTSPIYEFMSRNKISYNFQDFDKISVLL